MSAISNCPHCGEPLEYWAGVGLYWSTCGSTGKKRSQFCIERELHSRAKADLGELESIAKDLADALGSTDKDADIPGADEALARYAGYKSGSK